jgi:carnitine O-palmitoyltransferase 2
MKVFHLNQLPLVRQRPDIWLYQIARNSSSSQGDYQFLHRSNMPTYYFQPSLPRLPIPKAEKSLERYLLAQRPLLTDEEYKVTEGYCKKFMKAGEISDNRMITESLLSKH